MIKPDAYTNIGKIIDAVYQNGYKISKLKMSRFNQSSVGEFYGEHKERDFYGNLVTFMLSDVVVGMELVKENAVEEWRKCIGPTDSDQARKTAPNSIRALFGTNQTKNAVHGSDSQSSMKREIEYWFGGEAKTRRMKTTALLKDCTLCIIKPHIVINGLAG